MLLKGIVLKCFSHIQMERTQAAVYHLLFGKRSIQTIHDAHLYDLSSFYGIYRSFNQTTFHAYITDLAHDGLLKKKTDTDQIFQLTEHGERWLAANQSSMPFHYYQGLNYFSVDHIFYERLLLLIQVLTNRSKHHYAYIPVVDQRDIMNWVKKAYGQMKDDVDHSLQTLHTELYHVLEQFENTQRHIFIDRLTGYQHFGLSLQQLATQYHMPVEDVDILLTGIVQRMLAVIEKDKKRFPFLNVIIEDQLYNQSMTQSAKQTATFLENGYDVEQVADMRQLTVNTIYDHIVEIALHQDHFDMTPYVNVEEQYAIMQAIQQSESLKLKHIKARLNDRISYFQIRLVLTTHKHLLKADGDI